MRSSALARRLRAAISICTCLVGVLAVGPGSASAAAPANDDLVNAALITSLPFTQAPIDLLRATTETGEPATCSPTGEVHNTVWYALQPAHDEVIQVIDGSTNVPVLSLFRAGGPGFDGLTLGACGSFFGTSLFTLHAGVSYVLQLAAEFPLVRGSSSLDFQVATGPPPDNDDFAHAADVDELPATLSGDFSFSTLEPGEPSGICTSGTPAGSVWYRFTPPVDEELALVSFGENATVYVGDRLADLTPVDDSCPFFASVFQANAGTTYYVQFVRVEGDAGTYSGTLQQPGPVDAQFVWNPTEPSAREAVDFLNFSGDPVGQPFVETTWDFGDGTPPAEGSNVEHRFRRDGNYTVTMSTTTEDGRTGTATQVVQVRTHDAAITSFDVPPTAKAGQTVTIRVTVATARYAEDVTLEVDRGADGVFNPIDQQGPFTVRPRRPHTFGFEYTFTRADARRHVVAFRATASIANEDADTANNTVIATTTVTR